MKVAGFGYCAGACLASMEELLNRLEQSFGAVDGLAAVSDKSELVQALGRKRGLPVMIIDNEALSGVDTLTASPYSMRARQTGSVAEAVALLAAHDGACLMGPRQISTDRKATCALAQGVIL